MSPKEMQERIHNDIVVSIQKAQSSMTLLDMWLQEVHNSSVLPEELGHALEDFYSYKEELQKNIDLIRNHFTDDNLPAYADKKTGELKIEEKPSTMCVTLEVLDSIINLFMPNSVKGIMVKSKLNDDKIVINVYENVKKQRAPETERTFEKLQSMEWIGDFAKKYYTTYEEQMVKYKDRMSNSTITIKYLVIEIDKDNEEFEKWVKDVARKIYKEQTGIEVDSVLLKLE